MVDKIDRPDTRRPYEIREAKQTKEDQHYQHNQREEAEKRYQKQLEGKEWNKFGAQAIVIKPLKVPRENITKVLFRNVKLFKGIGILQADVIWRDKRSTIGALLRLVKLEDFFHLKKFSPAQEVPEKFWARGPVVELGIPQSISGSGSFPMESRERENTVKTAKPDALKPFLKAIGLLDRQSGKVSWGMVFFYAIVIAVIATAVFIN